VQIYAATNGFLDRINVERVSEFLLELTERMRAQHGDLLASIAGGDWSEDTQKAVHEAVEEFARDFGYDLDEEGQPLDDDAPPVQARSSATQAEGDSEQAESDRDKEPQAA
jgi:F-type H+-transporting ATPase subunit alpha